MMTEQEKIHTIPIIEMLKNPFKSVRKWIQNCFKSMEKKLILIVNES